VPKTTYYSAHTQPNGLALTYTPKNAAEIIAAGALIWRVRNSKIELLIIHRPRYDDWSWPKGKQDAGETIPETAIREISEEVQLRVHLGVPLGTTRYKVNSKTKDVFYWAAQLPAGQKPRADKDEVDNIQWVSIKKARTMLTNPSDLQPLEAFENLWTTSGLDTHPIIIARHTKAKPRANWSARPKTVAKSCPASLPKSSGLKPSPTSKKSSLPATVLWSPVAIWRLKSETLPYRHCKNASSAPRANCAVSPSPPRK